ncbi:cell division protein FtsA [Candidatus Uhrbacteria bacterium]|nr:cell division protein FtsA [Candidatus Uhrbacteria bacterium]
MGGRAILCGIDVGSRAIRLAAGERIEGPRTLRIVGVAEIPSAGVRRGTITSMEDAVASIAAASEQLERMIGGDIRSGWVSVSGPFVTTRASRGVVAVARTDGEVQEGDVERALEAARAGATPPNFEVLHIIPRAYALDHQDGIRDPVGMTGARLEVDAQIIQALSSHIRNLTKSIFQSGLEVDDLVLGILATAEAVTTPRQRELGVAVVNIGATMTSLVVEEEGDVVHLAVIPIGAEHVTSDIAIGLRVALDQAEQLKIAIGSALPREMKKQDEVDLGAILGTDAEPISRKYVAEIIEARTEELCERIDRELSLAGRSGSLPAGAILVGGGAKLPGIADVAKRKLRLAVALGKPEGIDSVVERALDPTFATAVGLVLWGAAAGDRGAARRPFGRRMIQPLNTIFDRTRNMVRSVFS